MSKATYRIGELAELAGVTRRTVHYYINKGLIPPAEGAGINSYYSADHLNRIRLIRKLQESYLPLEEIRKLITPLDPSRVVEQLEQDERGRPPVNETFLVQEMKMEESYQSAAGGRLYERVDLGGDIELHFPVELKENNPALLHTLIETARKIIGD